MKHVVVVGGGITGLTVAERLVRAGGVRVSLLESRPRLGGNIHTVREAGLLLDCGPDAWIVTKPEGSALAKELGLESDLVGTREENRRVYIAHEQALHPMPEGLVLGIPTEIGPMATTPLLSWEGKLRAGLDLVIPRRVFHESEDESVHAFITRRLGEEVADRLVAPLLGGIFAGDAAAISVRAAFPQLAAAEEKHGSLIRAMRAAKAQGGARTRPAPSAFVSLAGGMSTFIEALAARVREGGAEIALDTRVIGLSERGAGLSLALADGRGIEADHVVLALPAGPAGALLAPLDAVAGAALGAILDYASTVAVFLAYPRAAVDHPLDATGFIVPRSSGRRLVATTFVTSKWAGRAPDDIAVFRVFLAAEGDVRAEADAALVAAAQRELGAFVPLRGGPVHTRVVKHIAASPQPKVGHPARSRALATLLARVPNVTVATSGIDGVGIPDCVKKGTATATALLERVG